MTGATIDAHALALTYLNQGQPGGALAALGHGSALFNSAAVDVTQAARVAATATTDHMHALLASTYESTGGLASATTHLHRALDGDPTNAAVQDVLERVIKRRHEPRAAQVPKRVREPSSDDDHEVPWAARRIGMAGVTFPPPPPLGILKCFAGLMED
ncbi:hypothetical protein AMAG_13153 [Allomyces macrogynus ATCC 38327]|uniref:Uncharacterized protein n=1 Tax=Allomyces macrogynus (strain ATCC 38327) TaxID=578462 RepID=A0A0L0T017_ALLM3|nr:hypothetical protein AMAG_13153 [Allomyces macrogynus ATCC 38327]|eukprot:KNE67975.1 hypothetical protein AMAG_13153 [Allomyces macrogynus ATCC 38327]